MEDAKVNIKVDTGNLKKELRGIVNELNNLEAGSERFQELAQRAGQLKDQIQDTQAVVKGLAGNAIENAANAFAKLGGIGITAFQGIAGAQAMFGSDSEELMELMAKLQGAMALGQALKDFGALGDTFTEIKSSVSGAIAKFTAWRAAKLANLATDKAAVATTTAQTVATNTQTTATGIATTATKLLGAALKAALGPIGLIIIAITAVVAAMAYFSSESNAAIESTIKKWDKYSDALDKKRQKLIKDNDFEIELLEAKGATEEQIHQRKMKNFDEEIQATSNSIKFEKAKYEYNAKMYKLLIEYDEEQANKFKESAAKSREALVGLRNDLDGLKKGKILESESFKTSEKEKTEKQKEESAKRVKDNSDEYAKKLKSLKDYNNQLRNEILMMQADTNEERLALENKFELKKFEIQFKGLENTKAYKDGLLLIEKKYQIQLKKIQDENSIAKNIEKEKKDVIKTETEINNLKLKIAKTSGIEQVALTTQLYQKEKDLLKEQLDYELIQAGDNEELKLKLKSDYALKLLDLEKQWADKSIKTEEDTSEKREDLWDKTFNTISLVGDELAKLSSGTWVDNLTSNFGNVGEAIANAFKAFDPDSEFSVVDKIGATMNAVASLVTTITASIGDALQQQAEEASLKREERYAAESEALKAQLESRAISQGEFEAKMAQLDQNKRQAELAAKRKAFKQDKALRITQATMSTAQAVIAAFASGGNPIVGAIFAAIAAAVGGAQIGIIASQEFRAAKGGVVPGNGPSNIDSVRALLAPGEMVINANSSRMFAPQLSAINMAGGGAQLAPTVPNSPSLNAINFQSNNQTQVIKAYVVEREISDSQRMSERIERANKF